MAVSRREFISMAAGAMTLPLAGTAFGQDGKFKEPAYIENTVVDQADSFSHGACGGHHRPRVSIAVDSKNEPWIAYANKDSEVACAHKKEGRWVVEIVHPFLRYCKYNSIFVDASDTVHVAYNPMEDLYYAVRREDGKWRPTPVDGTPSTGLENDIVVDGDGKAHISHWCWSTKKVRYSTNKSGSWETVDVREDAWVPTVIELGPGGKPEIRSIENADREAVLRAFDVDINHDFPNQHIVYTARPKGAEKSDYVSFLMSKYSGEPSDIRLYLAAKGQPPVMVGHPAYLHAIAIDKAGDVQLATLCPKALDAKKDEWNAEIRYFKIKGDSLRGKP